MLLQERSRESYASSFWLAGVHAAIGESDAAFDCLERAREERDGALFFLTFVPQRLGLHGHPRFEELVRSTGLGHLLPVKNPT